MRIKVVLPTPLGPTRPIRSPARASNFRPLKIGSPANCRPRSLAEMRIMNAHGLEEWAGDDRGPGSPCRNMHPRRGILSENSVDSCLPRHTWKDTGRNALDRSIPGSHVLPAERPLLPEHMMIMLGEPVGLVADVLEQPEGERATA